MKSVAADGHEPRPKFRRPSVVVTGTNLASATAVTFGSVAAASFVIDSATQITAIAPQQP